MMKTEKEDNYTKVTPNSTTEQTEKRKRRAIPMFLFFFLILFIIIVIILICFFKTKKDSPSDRTTTESTQTQDEDITNTESEEPQITDETPSCAPIYTGGEIVSHTSTDTTWSYYFSEATRESVSGYVQNLKGNGWSTISEKTIVNTSFWDLQKENCFINLRYHSTDGGVILEVREEAN